MNQYRLAIAMALTCAILTTACKKTSDDTSDVTFVNDVSMPVTLDIYNNADDYNNASNVYLRKTLQPNESTTLPTSSFKTGQAYYMDWYTDDYLYTNWYNDLYPVLSAQVMIKPRSGANTYYMKPELKSNSRIAFLSKTATSTKWKAIGAYTENTEYISHWNELSADAQYREVTIYKDFTAAYSYKNSAGDIVTDHMPFKVQDSETPYLEFYGSDGNSSGSMAGGRLASAPPPNYASTSTDSVMALLPNSDFYFLMVKE